MEEGGAQGRDGGGMDRDILNHAINEGWRDRQRWPTDKNGKKWLTKMADRQKWPTDKMADNCLRKQVHVYWIEQTHWVPLILASRAHSKVIANYSEF